MKTNRTAPGNQAPRRILSLAGATALAVAIGMPQGAHAEEVAPPPVPEAIQVPAGSQAFLVGHAVGTQNYICVPTSNGIAWTLFTPQATLLDDAAEQITTHFFSPNPFETSTVRPAWQDSEDTSTVWGQGIGSSTDPNYVAPGAIPWLLIRVVGAEYGPTGGDTLTQAAFIQRLNTTGGVAPSTGCRLPKDIGAKVFVPYTADYFFYLAP